MRKDLLELHSLLPNVKLLTSAMLPRLSWPAFFPLDKVEKKRKHLNRFLRRITNFLGGDFITHDEINAETPGFYFRDGIHLSDVGCDMFLLAIKESIENILSKNYRNFGANMVRVAENSGEMSYILQTILYFRMEL